MPPMTCKGCGAQASIPPHNLTDAGTAGCNFCDGEMVQGVHMRLYVVAGAS